MKRIKLSNSFFTTLALFSLVVSMATGCGGGGGGGGGGSGGPPDDHGGDPPGYEPDPGDVT